jgi:hypothetical protein
MASTGNRTITIRIISEDQSAAPSPNPSDNEDGKGKPSPDASSDSSKKKSKSLFAKMNVAEKAKNLVLQEAELYAGKYLATTEDYRAQTTLQNAKNLINGVSSIAVATISGAKVGGVPGAIIGATMATVNKVQSAISTNFDSCQAIIENAYSNYFYGTRAGLASGGYGTEN